MIAEYTFFSNTSVVSTKTGLMLSRKAIFNPKNWNHTIKLKINKCN